MDMFRLLVLNIKQYSRIYKNNGWLKPINGVATSKILAHRATITKKTGNIAGTFSYGMNATKILEPTYVAVLSTVDFLEMVNPKAHCKSKTTAVTSSIRPTMQP